MATRCDLIPSKTYANEDTLTRALDILKIPDELRYHVAWTKEGRCYPIFMGSAAIQYGIHFRFPVIGG